MNELKRAFYNVMYKYEKCFTEHGVMANLNTWQSNKGGLVNLLRKHPNWDEKNLAIIFKFSSEREIDQGVVNECVFALNELAEECIPGGEQRVVFKNAIQDITSEYNKIPSDDCITKVKENTGIQCCLGLKTSRIIGKLCKHYKIHTHESYNRVYARLADEFNPLHIQQTGLLSVHPCDFLEMSNRYNSWRSCHSLDGGEYQSGCLSYLADSVSMIFYTVDNDVTDNFHEYPKRHRQVFCYNENVLLQSKLYPDHVNEDCEQFRGLIQQALSTCLDVPNLWEIKNRDASSFYRTVEDSVQYPDYDSYGKITLLKGANQYGVLDIGRPPICVGCGQTTCCNKIKCSGCENLTVCADCGETVPIKNALRYNDVYYCQSCMHYCPLCHTYVQTDMHSVRNHNGEHIHVCDECYERIADICRSCGVHSACTTLSASSYCSKVAALASAA